MAVRKCGTWPWPCGRPAVAAMPIFRYNLPSSLGSFESPSVTLELRGGHLLGQQKLDLLGGLQGVPRAGILQGWPRVKTHSQVTKG